jgi:hypothetical protein
VPFLPRVVTVSVERASQVARVKVVEPGRDRNPVARHADLKTASIPTELDFGRYRHAQEVTDSMSIETVDTRARAAAAVALVRQGAPETRFLPIAGAAAPTCGSVSTRRWPLVLPPT